MSAPTLFDPWTQGQETLRVNTLATGLSPRLFRYWVSTPTEQLERSLAEYRESDLDWLAEVVADIEIEIAYRSGT